MTDKTKIMIIGAGNIGIAIASMLLHIDAYEISISDKLDALSSVTALKHLGVAKVLLDASSDAQLREVLKSYDYVINAGPYHLASTIAMAAIKTETHYFDLTEDVFQTDRIRSFASIDLKTVLVPQCGLAPGYISILANHVAQQFDQVCDVKMRVGALPINPTNALKYNTSWSIDGLINEYLHPCNAIKNGKMTVTEPLEGYETFVLDGVQYEAFNTSGGLGTMCETWKGKVDSMSYKTVRYPGHNYLMKFLIDDMNIEEQQLKDMMTSAVPSTSQDVVVILVEVTGMKNGKLVTKNETRKIYGNHGWSGIQLATASGVCTVVEIHRQNLIQTSEGGFIKQEDINYDDFVTINRAYFNNVYNTI